MNRRSRLGIVLLAVIVIPAAVYGFRIFEKQQARERQERRFACLTQYEETLLAPHAPIDGLPVLETPLSLEPVASFEFPTDLTYRTDDPHLYVTTRRGEVHAIDPASGETTLLLDLTDRVATSGEAGMLGAAIDSTGGKLYLSYVSTSLESRIEAWELPAPSVSGAVAEMDPNASRLVFSLQQPTPNHNAGDLGFDGDGLLYASFGDGGNQLDPAENGQNPATIFGSIIRIDPTVDEAATYGRYAIPGDNPFAAGSTPEGERAAPEVAAFGLRNPWRFSIDQPTGEFWVGDTGDGCFEEIDNFDPSDDLGVNYGWARVEGVFLADGPAPRDHRLPVFSYRRDHSLNRCANVGAVRYRGDAIPELDGHLLVADFCNDLLTAVPIDDPQSPIDVPVTAVAKTALVVGPDGEIFVLSAGAGVSRLVPEPEPDPEPEGQTEAEAEAERQPQP